MRVMWLSSIVPPLTEENSLPTGGWIGATLKELTKLEEIEHVDVVGVHRARRVEYNKNKRLSTIRIPSKSGLFQYDQGLKHFLRKIIAKNKPDIVDVQGVEFYLVKSLLETETAVPIVATIQGLASACYQRYNAGVETKEIVKNLTIRNILLRDGLFGGRTNYKRRAANEIEVMKNIEHFLGRTDWDKAYALSINRNANYYHCNRILRSQFYNANWEFEKIDKYSIYTTQARYPLKGLHVLLKAIAILKKDFPRVKLTVSGKNLTKKSTLRDYLAYTDYQKFIKKLIDILGLSHQVEFTGFLNAEQVVQRLCKTHVFVLPSFIENSPNALAEAQMIGVPSIASYVGGNPTYVKEGKTGLLYDCNDHVVLAEKIACYFDDASLCNEISKKSKKIAYERHDPQKNVNVLMKHYKRIVNR